jgi:hypothetical protein
MTTTLKSILVSSPYHANITGIASTRATTSRPSCCTTTTTTTTTSGSSNGLIHASAAASTTHTASDSDCSLTSRTASSSVVMFGDVQVREFERIAGDHPAVTDRGPPLSIGWAFHQGEAISLDAFEAQQQQHQHKRCLSSSLDHNNESQRCLNTSPQPIKGDTRRMILLHGFDVSKDDIQEMEREVEKTKKQRHETASLPKWKEQVEIVVQSAGRKLKRWSFSSSS